MTTKKKPPAKDSAIDWDALRDDVVSTLNNWESWAPKANESELISPVQFLAVITWALEALRGGEFSDGELSEVLRDWWGNLSSATAMRCANLGGSPAFRYVIPYNALTYLELPGSKVSRPDGWCMNTKNADAWLEAFGYSALCKAFFESCVNNESIFQADTGMTAKIVPIKAKPQTVEISVTAPKVLLKDQKSEWTGAALGAKKTEFVRDGKGKQVKRLAELVGLPEREISRRITNANPPSPWGALLVANSKKTK